VLDEPASLVTPPDFVFSFFRVRQGRKNVKTFTFGV